MRDIKIDAQQVYLESLCPPETPMMLLSKELAKEVKGEGISLSRHEGHLLSFFTHLIGAKKIVEIGTLTGYSAQWLLSALPRDGKIWTLEKDPERANRAKKIFSQLGDSRLELMEGDAQKTLQSLVYSGPYDLIFIDANKKAYSEYADWAEKNLRVGGLMIADNVFLGGSVYGVENRTYSQGQTAAMKAFQARDLQQKKWREITIPTSEGLQISLKL